MIIAHLSDPHFDGTAAKRARVQRAIDYLESRAEPIDVALVTGDIADSGEIEQYAEAVEMFGRLSMPVHFLPGNHDARGPFAEGLFHRQVDPDEPLDQQVEIGGTLLCLLDSTIPGEPGGAITEDVAAGIGLLAHAHSGPMVLALHHPPVAVGMPYMDGMRLADAPALERVVAGMDNIVGVLCGHIHSAMATTFGGKPLIAAPPLSTVLNLPTEGADLLNEAQPPGLALHRIAGGTMVTHFRAL